MSTVTTSSPSRAARRGTHPPAKSRRRSQTSSAPLAPRRDLAAFVVSLLALVDDWREPMAREGGPAGVLLAAIDALLARVRTWSATEGATLRVVDDGVVGGLALAGASSAPTAAPALSPVHLSLAHEALEAIEEASEASDILWSLAKGADTVRACVSEKRAPESWEAGDLEANTEDLRDTLARLTATLGAIAHHLTGESLRSSPARHAAALARLGVALTGDGERRDLVHHARRAFARTYD